jgi:PII-like signaling protein
MKTYLQICLFFGDNDRFEDKPLSEYLMRFLMRSGIKGATSLRGRMGFGAHHHLHLPMALGSADTEPQIIICADEESRIRPLLGYLQTLVPAITVMPVEMYISGQ